MATETITLTDESTGSRASVLVGLGFNCYRFEPVVQGQCREVLWAAPNFESGLERPSGSGIPLLFPFPGRIGGASFDYDGRTFSLDPGDGHGNAIHGFVLNRPWNVIERHGSRLVGRFQASVDDPALLDQWPADFRITAVYELRGNILTLDLKIENPDQRPLPFGLGIHPYFRAAGVSDSAPDEVRVTVPASSYWELDHLLPTGRQRPVDAARDLRRGSPLAKLELDDVLGDLKFDRGRCSATIKEPNSGRSTRLAFDSSFTTCVVYTPPHREAICIEPYTCVPDVFRLSASGIKAGLRILQPGETFQSSITLAAE